MGFSGRFRHGFAGFCYLYLFSENSEGFGGFILILIITSGMRDFSAVGRWAPRIRASSGVLRGFISPANALYKCSIVFMIGMLAGSGGWWQGAKWSFCHSVTGHCMTAGGDGFPYPPTRAQALRGNRVLGSWGGGGRSTLRQAQDEREDRKGLVFGEGGVVGFRDEDDARQRGGSRIRGGLSRGL